MLPFNQGIIIPCFNEHECKRLDTVKDILKKLIQLIKTLLILVKNS